MRYTLFALLTLLFNFNFNLDASEHPISPSHTDSTLNTKFLKEDKTKVTNIDTVSSGESTSESEKFYSLIKAHKIAMLESPERLSTLQLEITNLLEDNIPTFLYGDYLTEIHQLVTTTTEQKYIDRFYRVLSYGWTKDCPLIQRFYTKELQYKASLPSSSAMLLLNRMMGKHQLVASEVRRLYCLTPEQLIIADSDKKLAKTLSKIFPENERYAHEFYKKLYELEKRLAK